MLTAEAIAGGSDDDGFNGTEQLPTLKQINTDYLQSLIFVDKLSSYLILYYTN